MSSPLPNAADRIRAKLAQKQKSIAAKNVLLIITEMEQQCTLQHLVLRQISEEEEELLRKEGFTVERVLKEARRDCPCVAIDDCRCGAENYSIISAPEQS